MQYQLHTQGPMSFQPTISQQNSFTDDGFIIVDRLVDPKQLPVLHKAFDDLFNGVFETGVHPDEVNWQQGKSDPSLSRQICNGWKANRDIAGVLLDESIAKAIAKFSGWSGVRIMIDNVIWKPPATKSLGFHQDNSYLSWFDPGEIMTCWIALDDTKKEGGTIEFARASHKWQLGQPEGEFHAPEDYRKPMCDAAAREGVEPEICHVEVEAGGGSFHHGSTWHGSGANLSNNPRRSLVLHAMPSEVRYVPANFDQGIGPIYSRYKRLGDNNLDENYFPILWRDDGYRTPQIDDYLRG
jgi:ectoine hydroxylase-related dioxygenase (phytanoyl-CoA dioxygenase family)